MRKTVTLLGVFLLGLLFSGVHELIAQKANPANLQKKNVITKNMFPEKKAPVMVAKKAVANVKSTGTVNDQIIEENAFLQGQFVEVGISNCGCFGTTVNQPAGFHGNVDDYLGFVADPDMDGWEVGDPAYNGDYFLPGSPEEGWGFEVDGSNYGNFGQCGDFDIPGTVTSINYDNEMHTGIWEGEMAGIKVTQDVSFMDDATYFIISATLTNTTEDTLRDVYYFRNVDPDNEVPAGGDYTTLNKIIYQANTDSCNRALAAGIGLEYGMFLGLGTSDERARATFGGFSNRSASDIWNGNGFNLIGEETNDIAISLSFKIGDLAPGESNVVMYTYVLDSTQVDEAIDAIVRLKANGNDITSTKIHSNCDQPVDLIVTGNPGFVWEWTNSPYLSDTIGDHVVFAAPLGTYNLSVTGTSACRQVAFNFTIVIETDATAPVVKARESYIAHFGDNDTATISAKDIALEVSDNCEIDTVYLSRYYFTKTDSGQIIPVVITAVDLNGLTARDTTLVSFISFEQFSILEKIIQYQDWGDASELTIEQLDSLGIDSVIVDNLGIYQDYIAGDWPKTIKEYADVQKIVTEANAIQIIRDMVDEGDATGILLSTLIDAGASSALAENLKYYEFYIPYEEPWDKSEVKYTIGLANKFATIDKMARNNDASTLKINTLWDVYMYDADENYLIQYKSRIEEYDSIPDPNVLEDLIYQVNRFMDIVWMAVNDDASSLDINLLEEAGVTGPNSNYLSVYADSIAARDTIFDLPDLQLLIDNINSDESFKLIVDMAYNDDASALTEDMLKDVGVELLITDFMTYYKDSIAATDTFITKLEVIQLVEAINAKAAFIMIQEMASNDDASALTNDLLIAAGLTGNRELYLDTYKEYVADADTIINLPGLQALIDQATAAAAFQIIQMMAYNEDASGLNTMLLGDATITSIIAKNLMHYKLSVESADTLIVVADLQLLIDVDNAWVALGDMTYANNASSLTVDMLELLEATGVVADNLAFYKLYVVSADTIETTVALQVVVDKANMLANLDEMAIANNASALTAAMLTLPGGTGVVEANLFAYKLYLAEASGVATVEELQDIIDAANAFGQVITMFNGGNTDALTIQMLVNAGVVNTQSAKLLLYKTIIKNAANINDLAALQALIDEANLITGVDVIKSQELKVYPVPVGNYLVIEGTFEHARLIGIDGKVLLNINSTESLTRIDLSEINSGIYILETMKSASLNQVMIIKE